MSKINFLKFRTEDAYCVAKHKIFKKSSTATLTPSLLTPLCEEMITTTSNDILIVMQSLNNQYT